MNASALAFLLHLVFSYDQIIKIIIKYIVLDLVFVAKFYKHVVGFILASRSIDARDLPLSVNGTESNSLC